MTWRAFLRLLSTLFCLRGVQASDLPVIQDGMSRRAFLTALGVSAAAMTTAPFDVDLPLWLDEPIVGGAAVGDGLVTADWITREALKILEKNLTFARTVNREYRGY